MSRLLVDAEQRRVAAVVTGRGRKVEMAQWAQLSGFGPDAVMVADEDNLRPPADDRERAVADGKLEPLGKRVLNELGKVDDVTSDADTWML